MKIKKTTLARHMIAVIAMSPFVCSIAQERGVLEEVVVTAQKRSQNAQDVPIALVAFSEDTMQQLGVEDFGGLSKSAPGLSINGSSQALPNIFMRGIGSNDVGIGSDPSIGVFVDGVYASRAGGALGELLDVAAVEILKGPQGTLFGRNSIGGAISIRTNQANEEFAGQIGVELGNYGARLGRFVVNAPVIDDKLFLRASGLLRKQDGWQRNLFTQQDNGSKDRATGNLKLRYLASDNLALELINTWNRIDEIAILTDNLSSSEPLSVQSTDRDDTNTVNGGRDLRGNAANAVAPIQPLSERNLRSHALKLRWDLSDNYSFNALSSYRSFSTASSASYDGSEFFVGHLEGNTESNESLSQEIRLDSNTAASDWFIGMSYAKEKNASQVRLGFFDFLGLNGGVPVFEASDVASATDSWAVYGDIAWHLSDQATLTVGGRYSVDKKSISYNNPTQDDSFRLLGGRGLILPTRQQFIDAEGNTAPYLADLHDDWSDFSPRLVFDYALLDDVLLYASISRGFKSGAFNSFPSVIQSLQSPSFLRVVPEATQSVKPEVVNNVELGMKSLLLDGRLRFNASLYHYQYKDLQVFSTNGPVVQLSNAGKASAEGVEVDGSYQVNEALRLSANLAWSDARYDEFVSDGNDLSGSRLLFSPEWSGGVSADFTHILSSGAQLRAFAIVNHRARHFLDVDYEQPSYTTVDARLSYYSPADDWRIALFGSNLGDRSYGVRYLDQAAAFSGFTSLYRNTPRTWGVALDYNF